MNNEINEELLNGDENQEIKECENTKLIVTEQELSEENRDASFGVGALVGGLVVAAGAGLFKLTKDVIIPKIKQRKARKILAKQQAETEETYEGTDETYDGIVVNK